MIRDRRHRLTIVLVALVSLLFMQLAVAGYICPGAASKMAEAAAMADAGMPCAESMAIHMDDEQPGLCHAHCQGEQASADKHESPPPAPIGALLPDFTIPVIIKAFSEAPLQAPHLQRTTAPPISIRNCCFRL